jgi:predicted nucleotidyltransferase component of viral defense system
LGQFDHKQVRLATIAALCSEDALYEQLILKGGSALDLIYQVGGRSSLDLDFSLEGDLNSLEATARLMQSALERHFRALGVHVFDFNIEPRPTQPQFEWWGGYRAEFKVIELTHAERLHFDLNQIRKQAIPIGDMTQSRRFVIEISKYEWCGFQENHEIDAVPVRVYAPALLASEKLRAICQQHEKYEITHQRSRARDFFDIHTICNRLSVDLTQHVDIVARVFDAKKVPWDLLGDIGSQRAVHEPDWPSVVASVTSRIEEFDYYFTYVVQRATALHALRVPDAPV